MPNLPNSSADRLDSTPIHPRRALWRRILLPRFSLRTLLILVTLFSFAAAWVGNWIYESEKQKRIVEILDRRHISIKYRNYIHFEDDRDRTWLKQFLLDHLGKDYLYCVDHAAVLNDSEPPVTIDYQKLSELEHITSLRLMLNDEHNCMAESDWANVAKLTELERLQLGRFTWSDTLYEKKYLERFAHLRSLSLSKPQYIDLTPVEGLTNLEEFNLQTTHIKLEELQKLKRLKPLKRLRIEGRSFHPSELDVFRYLSETFPQLEMVAVGDQVKIESLAPFQTHPRLKVVKMSMWKKEQEEELKTLLPNVIFEFEGFLR